ncbi:serine hydrolase domain-containing protein [Rubinisphaera italica]|nr:serine hydrolase domain-containing protein [Rubinisphaera italica]
MMSFSREQWEELEEWSYLKSMISKLVTNDKFSAISLQAFCETSSPVLQMGRQRQDAELNDDSLFLIASLTKPVIATAILKLVELGKLSLNQRLSEILPEWNRGEKRRITIRQLLCHASGLPDQLPENLELRDQQATLDEFYQRVIDVSLDYPPGTSSRYQSMGYLVLAKVVEKLTRLSLEEFIHLQIFIPLGMNNSFLGIPASANSTALLNRVVDVDLPEEQLELTGNWNSDYWRSLGAPWGGMLSTSADMLKFCVEMTKIQRGAGTILSSASLKEAYQPQLSFFEQMSEREKNYRSWGLGWRHNWKAHPETFGDTLPENVIGHWGATGCLMWIDLDTNSAAVICTTKPSSQSRVKLVQLSNMVHTVIQASCRKFRTSQSGN